MVKARPYDPIRDVKARAGWSSDSFARSTRGSMASGNVDDGGDQPTEFHHYHRRARETVEKPKTKLP